MMGRGVSGEQSEAGRRRQLLHVLPVSRLYLLSGGWIYGLFYWRNILPVMLPLSIVYVVAYLLPILWPRKVSMAAVHVGLTAIDSAALGIIIARTGGLVSDIYLVYFVQVVAASVYAGMKLAAVTGFADLALFTVAALSDLTTTAAVGLYILRASLLVVVTILAGWFGERSISWGSQLEAEKEHASERQKHAEAIARLTRAVASETDPNRVLERILAGADEVLEADQGMLATREGPRFHVRFVHNMPETSVGEVVEPDVGISGRVLTTGQTVFTNDYQHDERATEYFRQAGVRAAIYTPIRSHGQVFGILGLNFKQAGRTIGPEEKALVEELAEMAGVALANAQNFQNATRRAERLRSLHEIGQVLAATIQVDELFRKIYEQVSGIMDTGAFFIALWHPETAMVEMRFLVDKGREYPPQTYPLSAGPASIAIKEKRAILITEDVDRVPGYLLGDPGDSTRSILVVPMIREGKVLGAISAQSYEPYAYTEEDQEILSLLAAQAAVALENARLVETTRQLSLTDQLTGLWNYRYLQEQLPREIDRAARYGHPLSVVMMDSDSLKYVNDRYGHDAGNEHLVALARAIQRVIRKTDWAVRYAGDEFFVILPETDQEGALALAERLRQDIMHTPLVADGQRVRTTVSMGVATYPLHAKNMEELLLQVDHALYASKRAGRNRVTVA